MKTTLSNMVRTVLVGSLLTVGFGLLPMQAIHADTTAETFGLNKVSNSPTGTVSAAGLDPRDLAQKIINALLGFLGIIAVAIILIAGFKWMTAGGNEDKVKEAQTMLVQGVIGLVIIVAAWGLATWVINQVVSVVGNGSRS